MAKDKDRVYVGLLQPGTIVGDSYRVETFLGKGGMGEVWAARHLRLANKRVAIKVLRTQGESLSEEALSRFRKEAEIASRLQHPHIVNIHDYNFTPSGYPFMVMEFLEGESLGTRLRREGPFSLAQTRTVIRQVCRALEATHSQGIIHRDLKPDNIFLTSQGTELWVKVLDFGISKILNSNTQLTQNSVVIGSPRYISPEQARGHNSQLTPQADIFSLGAVAYEMLTGKSAFEGDEVSQVLFRVVYESPRSLAEVLPELPVGARRAVETALEKQPEKRYASAMAFSEALDRDSFAPTKSTSAAPEASPLMPELEDLTDSVKPVPAKCPWLLMVVVGALAVSLVGGAIAYRQYALKDAVGMSSGRPAPGVLTKGAAPGGPPTSTTETSGSTSSSTGETSENTSSTAEASGSTASSTDDSKGSSSPPGDTATTPTPTPKAPPKTTKTTTPPPPPKTTLVRAPPPPEPPPLNAEEQRILARAEKALKAKQYNDAEVFARRSLTSLERNGAGWARAYAIVAEVACAQKDLPKYTAAIASVPVSWRPSVKTACKRLDFEPPP